MPLSGLIPASVSHKHNSSSPEHQHLYTSVFPHCASFSCTTIFNRGDKVLKPQMWEVYGETERFVLLKAGQKIGLQP